MGKSGRASRLSFEAARTFEKGGGPEAQWRLELQTNEHTHTMAIGCYCKLQGEKYEQKFIRDINNTDTNRYKQHIWMFFGPVACSCCRSVFSSHKLIANCLLVVLARLQLMLALLLLLLLPPPPQCSISNQSCLWTFNVSAIVDHHLYSSGGNSMCCCRCCCCLVYIQWQQTTRESDRPSDSPTVRPFVCMLTAKPFRLRQVSCIFHRHKCRNSNEWCSLLVSARSSCDGGGGRFTAATSTIHANMGGLAAFFTSICNWSSRKKGAELELELKRNESNEHNRASDQQIQWELPRIMAKSWRKRTTLPASCLALQPQERDASFAGNMS